ncbi:arylsulfatase B-like [Epargyreus clarus]|uniref:arylsulfatase B-like n=1 Tax=Epargyreus clarus TaxID=520877 RepID=UPI003C2F1605
MWSDSKLIWRKWLFLALVASVSASYYSQPNIVFIMADDMGWNDVGYHGSDQIPTPNIDALAMQSVILQQYYSEAICTPARSALLTGKYPMRLGMQGFPLYNSEDRGIPLSERLLPSYLKALGYSTHLVGKWHVGMSRPEFLPTARGYDDHYGMRGGFVDYYTYNKVETWPNGRLMHGLDLFDNDIPQVNEDRYAVDLLTERAINIIHSRNTSCPMFLHVTHTAPHAGNTGGPLQPPLYRPVGHRHIAHSDRRLYAELVAALDHSVGRIVEALYEAQILHNTIIVFMSDNGAPTVGDLNNWGVNLPFRGRKETPWEGAVRVPAFIWHAGFKPRICDSLMHITDWLPTLIRAAGGSITHEIDGINQWDSLVLGSELKRKEVLIAIEDGGNNVYGAYRAGDYKIILGNVTGMRNDYYGEDFMINKEPPPPYFPVLTSSYVAAVFQRMGIYFDPVQVQATRDAAMIRQKDKERDATLCLPTATRGCLFNVRQDPMESHDLWDRANNIAKLLERRLRMLWGMQMRRGPLALGEGADPANFGYTWEPWIYNGTDISPQQTTTPSSQSNKQQQKAAVNARTKTKADNCDCGDNFRNFVCLFRCIF